MERFAFLAWPRSGHSGLRLFWNRADYFCKREGKIALKRQFVLGPCLIGQYLSLLYYRRQCRSWDEITPCVWIGGKLGRREAKSALQAGVTSVLDLSAEFSETKPFSAVCYRNIPILDLTAPTLGAIARDGQIHRRAVRSRDCLRAL